MAPASLLVLLPSPSLDQPASALGQILRGWGSGSRSTSYDYNYTDRGPAPSLGGRVSRQKAALGQAPRGDLPLVFQSHLLKSERIRARVLMKCHMLLQGRTVPAHRGGSSRDGCVNTRRVPLVLGRPDWGRSGKRQVPVTSPEPVSTERPVCLSPPAQLHGQSRQRNPGCA